MKKPVLCLALAMASTAGLAAETSRPALDRLVDCADIKESRQRLACFDREVAPLASARSATTRADAPQQVVRAPAPAPVAPVPGPAATPAPASEAPRSFGEDQLPKSRVATASADAQTMHANIERLRTVAASQFVIYLDNGQAWRHEDQVQGEYLREGEAITISKGTLGSYRLTRDAGKAKNWIRVTRIR